MPFKLALAKFSALICVKFAPRQMLDKLSPRIYYYVQHRGRRKDDMAAPQTHLATTFAIRALLTFAFGIIFSKTELFLIYFWGCGLDFVDHFTSPGFTRDVFFVRIPRFFKGGAVGAPSKGVELPTCWLHIWPGAMLSIICGLVFFPQMFSWIPLLFWLQHTIIDRGQKNEGGWPEIPFLYPAARKRQVKKRGYPVKARLEILISTALAALIIAFELYYNFLK